MMQEYKKLILVIAISVIMALLLILFTVFGFSLGPINVASITTILEQYDKIKKSEEQLNTKHSSYNKTLATLESAKKTYETEKAEYEAISDETVEVIKEATTQEEYSIEYMWIRLGNYARMNNLSIVLIEPGGGQETSTAPENTNSNTTTSTPVESSANTTNTNTQNANSSIATASSGKENISTMSSNTDLITEESNRGEIFKIQVSGSYMNVSDFVFAVENDNELRFKLDNISMEYVSGTTIKTTFDVKNMIIKK